MQKIQRIALLATAILACNAYAQAPNARTLFESGATDYLKSGAASAISTWLKGSALEGNTQATSQANTLRQIEDFYGKPESFEFVSESSITNRSSIVLGVINYQKGPLYARFQIYKLPTGLWVATEFKFHTEAAQIFPERVLYGRP